MERYDLERAECWEEAIGGMVDSAKVEPRVVGEGEEQRGWGKEGRTGIMAEIKVKKSKEAADRRPSGLKTSLCVVSLPISVVQRERERERERESVCVCSGGGGGGGGGVFQTGREE